MSGRIEETPRVTPGFKEQKYSLTNPDEYSFKRLLNEEILAKITGITTFVNCNYNGGTIWDKGNRSTHGITGG